jgi:helicase
LAKIRVLFVDEIHLIHDPKRGPTLEVIISRFKALNPGTQIIALSATIKNALDLASWLDGKLITSDWRPVPLSEGVCYKYEITYADGKTVKIDGSEKGVLYRLVETSLLDGGQVLVFVNTRRATISLASNLALVVEKMLTRDAKNRISESIARVKQEQSEFTSVDKKLFYCLERGVAFHNAGLASSQRRIVEQEFKNHVIKCIVATPTLAAGINMPAQRVIIRDLWRYDRNFGMKPIPILEYKQQAGRAGRPSYDEYGDAITIAKNKRQKEEIFTNYILADTEPIYSKLGSEAALRMHLLSAIATNFVDSMESILRFIDSTFYAYQSQAFTLEKEISRAVDFLIEHGFIEYVNQHTFFATSLGKKTSSLYIDPLSALILKKALERSFRKKISPLSLLHAVCSTPDVYSLYLRKADIWLDEKLECHQGEFLLDPPIPSSEKYDWFLSDLKTASLIEDWIEEIPEEKIVSKYSVGPGDIHNIVETSQWLLHAARELARMYNFECVPLINDLTQRVHYGCKKELLNLVSLKGIGRVRARALFNEGFKTIYHLRGVPLERLARVKTIGEGIARSIKSQIGESEKGEDKELSQFSSE